MAVEIIARLVIGIGAIIVLADMTSDKNKKYFGSDIDKATMFLFGAIILICIVG